MTRDEFLREISRLSAAFERTPFNQVRVEVFWKLVHDLPSGFFRRQVDKMIIEYRVFDFSDAAAAERRALKSYQSMKDIGAREDFERGPEKLREVFQKMGIKSIDDALRSKA